MNNLYTKPKAVWTAVATSLLLAACSSTTDYQQQAATETAKHSYFSDNTNTQNYSHPLLQQTGASDLTMKTKQWWLNYKSEQLNALVINAQQNNLNLQSAAKRYAAAQQRLGANKAQYLPQGGLNAEATRASVANQITEEASFGLGLTWQLDLFGRISSLVDAAQAATASAYETQIAINTQVTAGVVRSFIEWQGLTLKQQIVQAQIDALNESVDVLQARVDEGFASHLDLDRTYAQLNQQLAILPQLQTQRFNLQASIAVLTATTPEQINLSFEPSLFSDNLAAPLQIKDSKQALLLRPEIGQAYYQLMQQTALSDSAKAALWPDISIGGFAGLLNPSNISLSADDDAWSVTPSINWSILSWPALQQQAEAQQTLTKAAYDNYQHSIIEVVAESQVALNNLSQSHKLTDYAGTRLSYADKALTQAQAMYEEGQVPYLDLLSARQDALLAKQAAVDAKINLMLAKVSTYKAFSGVWSR
ncbi:lipoprotein [Catenovulum agarivorans DS-2]|uniref:Lipoprotein n=1 Tax=Catenovulum agarivorans DS-2 TaxID=1328313 RepID=W7R1C8_9ALTE|nr:TolC family protein [Catenovulum agarivorans]EWH11430.1 lipoprotein [Catenovulum agarivorans DS-2]